MSIPTLLKSGMDPYFVGKIHKPFDQPSRVKKTLQLIYNQEFSEMPALIPIPKVNELRQ